MAILKLTIRWLVGVDFPRIHWFLFWHILFVRHFDEFMCWCHRILKRLRLTSLQLSMMVKDIRYDQIQSWSSHLNTKKTIQLRSQNFSFMIGSWVLWDELCLATMMSSLGHCRSHVLLNMSCSEMYPLSSDCTKTLIYDEWTACNKHITKFRSQIPYFASIASSQGRRSSWSLSACRSTSRTSQQNGAWATTIGRGSQIIVQQQSLKCLWIRKHVVMKCGPCMQCLRHKIDSILGKLEFCRFLYIGSTPKTWYFDFESDFVMKNLRVPKCIPWDQEKLRILAMRLEHDEHVFDFNALPPKPPYRQNATTRWGLAPSRVPIDMPEIPKAPSKKPTRVSSKRATSKRTSSKRPQSKEHSGHSKASKTEETGKASKTGSLDSGSATATGEAESTGEVKVPKAEQSGETSSATDSLAESKVAEPKVAEAKAETTDNVDKVDNFDNFDNGPSAEMGFSEEDFIRMYQMPERKHQRTQETPTIAGRPQGAMWMSSTLGGAPGIGPDILALMRRSSFLKSAFEKLKMSDQSSLPELYRTAWPSPKPRQPKAKSDGRPQSATRLAMAFSSSRVAPEPQRPRSTATRRKPDVPLQTTLSDRPFSAATRGTLPTALGSKKGRHERKRR